MIPPFCPNPSCTFHDPKAAAENPSPFYQHNGSHFTKVVGDVPRYRCVSCGRTFCDRTFEIGYWTRKLLPYREILRSFSAGEPLAAIGRGLACKGDTVQNRLERLGRNAIALHARMTVGLTLREDLAADGFESFDRSQFFPNNINLLVGVESQFLYGFTFTSLRRKGRMTDSQRRRRAVYDKVCPLPRNGVAVSFTRLVSLIPGFWDPATKPKLILRSDEHPTYPKSIQRVKSPNEASANLDFRHERYSSKLTRTPSNPLFPVNYYDRELRKDIAAYRRESTCVCRNVSNGLLRFMSHMAWHNYRKDYRVEVRRFAGTTHAEVAGLEGTRVDEGFEGIFGDRAFQSHLRLNGDMKMIWLKSNKTPLKQNPDYIQKFACVGFH